MICFTWVGRTVRNYNALQPQLPPPLLPRERCFEIPERLDHKGQVIAPLDERALGATLDQLEREGLEAIAVCFLFSYVNPQHERRVRDRLLERGIVEPWQVVLSSDVLPEFREYERASTVALEAFVRPVMNRYIERLEARLPTNTELRVMRSDGGVSRAASVREQAIHTALSGAGRRRDWRLSYRTIGGLRAHHHPRYGWHLHRCFALRWRSDHPPAS